MASLLSLTRKFGFSPPSTDESSSNEEEMSLDPTAMPGWRKMKVAIWQTAAGLKAPSGGYRGNYALAHALSKHGHDVMQFCWAKEGDIEEAIADLKTTHEYRPHMIRRGTVSLVDDNEKAIRVPYHIFRNIHNIKYVVLDAKLMLEILDNVKLCEDSKEWIESGVCPKRTVPYVRWMTKNLDEHKTTHAIFNDVFTCKFTETMLAKKPKLVRVEIVHTAEQIPVGPFSGGMLGSAVTPLELELWKRLDAIVAVSNAIKRYARDECDLNTTMIPNHVWAFKDRKSSNWPRRRENFGHQTVVMINPCAVKGYSIFLEMAKANQKRMLANQFAPTDPVNQPSFNYVAYATWGAKPHMKEALALAGVQVRQAVTEMEPVWDRISVLVVPSLWFEAWGMVITEAQLRGIPVIASDVGGINEAKRFVGPLIKVKPVSGEKRNVETRYDIPEQDVSVWTDEVDRLLTNKDYYEDIATASWYAARTWVASQDVRAMEKLLLRVTKQ